MLYYGMDDIAYRRAKARVEAQLGFYWHLTVYLLVNLVLVIINLRTTPDRLWFFWPMFGWGVGVISHGAGVFSYRWGGARKEAMIQREMEREARLRQTTPSS